MSLMKRIFFLIAIVILLTCFNSCFTNEPDRIILDIPYSAQIEPAFCGVACIQMWAHYDHPCCEVSQLDIADYVGVGAYGVLPWDILRGVSHFTSVEGFLALKDIYTPGAQGDLLGATITGIKNGQPSILPTRFGEHAIIIRGHEWHEENGRPIADEIFYHDPDDIPDLSMPANLFLNYVFTPPTFGDYWAIIAFVSFFDAGIAAHDEFVLSNGTYYGGPLHYDPKGLVPDPPIN